jgi:Cu/Ag efflux protein CusF
MIVVVFIVLLIPGYASAAERLHGVVLAVTPKTGEVIVRHAAFGSMPAMTMSFRIIPRERAAQLQPGAEIDADVDTKTEPWTLSHVRSTSTQALTSDVSPLRRVTPLRIGDTVPDTAFVDQAGRQFRDPSIGIIHDENTVVIDRDGRIRRMITETSWLPGEILAVVDQQNGIASNPIARFNLWLSDKAVALCGNSVAGFSGLTDLAVVLAVFAALAYLLYRLGRGIFRPTA